MGREPRFGPGTRPSSDSAFRHEVDNALRHARPRPGEPSSEKAPLKHENARRLDHEPKGRSVKSADPRKAAVSAAFKAATGATTVTLVHESLPGTFQARCLRKGALWSGEGNYEMEWKP